MATALVIAQRAALKLGIAQPSELFASTERTNKELAEAMTEAVDDILDCHDWQLLRTIATITGDGSTLAWDIESDFHRLLLDPELYSSEFEVALSFVADPNEWLRYQTRTYDSVVNLWHLYQDQINTDPALGSGTTAQYWYISNLVITDADTTTKAVFDADDDTFRLDDDLLRLGTIYKFRQNKGQPYAEEMADYERKKAKCILKDGGARTFRSGRGLNMRGVRNSYPQNVS